MLRQAFLNLALNACQAMPDGGTLRIRCEAVRGRRVAIVVHATPASASSPSTSSGSSISISRRRRRAAASACRWSIARCRCTTARLKYSRHQGPERRSECCCRRRDHDRQLYLAAWRCVSRRGVAAALRTRARRRCPTRRRSTCRRRRRAIVEPIEAETPAAGAARRPNRRAAAPPAAASRAARTGAADRAAEAAEPPKPPEPPPLEPIKPAEEPPPAAADAADDAGDRGRRSRARDSRDAARARPPISTGSTTGRSTPTRETQYDTAKRFIRQAEDAMRTKNLLFAKNLADKAAALAAQLGGGTVARYLHAALHRSPRPSAPSVARPLDPRESPANSTRSRVAFRLLLAKATSFFSQPAGRQTPPTNHLPVHREAVERRPPSPCHCRVACIRSCTMSTSCE